MILQIVNSGNFYVWLLANTDKPKTQELHFTGVSVHFSCQGEAFSHVVLLTTASASHTSCLTPRRPHPASVNPLTEVQNMLATHETASSVSCWDQHTQIGKNDYLNPLMSELCVISCSGLVAKWSHLSQKKKKKTSPLPRLQGPNPHLLSKTVRKAESMTPSSLSNPSRYSIQQWPTAAPCSQRHRIDAQTHSDKKPRLVFSRSALLRSSNHTAPP